MAEPLQLGLKSLTIRTEAIIDGIGGLSKLHNKTGNDMSRIYDVIREIRDRVNDLLEIQEHVRLQYKNVDEIVLRSRPEDYEGHEYKPPVKFNQRPVSSEPDPEPVRKQSPPPRVDTTVQIPTKSSLEEALADEPMETSLEEVLADETDEVAVALAEEEALLKEEEELVRLEEEKLRAEEELIRLEEEDALRKEEEELARLEEEEALRREEEELSKLEAEEADLAKLEEEEEIAKKTAKESATKKAEEEKVKQVKFATPKKLPGKLKFGSKTKVVFK